MENQELKSPLILMMETATNVGSVALYEGSDLLGHVDIHKARLHARLLLPLVKNLLSKLDVSPQSLSAIAVSQGPGSYTGLRVGVSAAKGLCMALDKPLMSITSLEVLAWQVQELAQKIDALICPMIDARRMEVYTAVFDHDINTQQDIHAHILDENSLADTLHSHKVVIVGDGAAKAESLFSSTPQALVLPQVVSSARNVGSVLLRKFQAKAFEDLVSFEPFYLKDFVATKPKDKLRETR